MYQKSRGIVLHTTRYSETSVIAKIYTEGFGLLSFIVKGVRSSRSKTKASLLQPLTVLDLEFLHRENKSLLFIKEFKRHYTYQSLPFDVLKTSVAMFILEVMNKSIREQDANIELFEFLLAALYQLDETPRLHPDFHLVFMVQFSRHLGFGPQENYTAANCYFEMSEGLFTDRSQGPYILNKEESFLMHVLIRANFYNKSHEAMHRLARKHMLQQIIKYYQLHLENFTLKSPDVLEALFE